MGRLFSESIPQMMTFCKRRPSAICAGFLIAAALGAACFTRLSWSANVEEVATMKSPERQKILIEGAKKEGKVTFYTGLIVDQVVRPLKEGFEKEYPFVQVDFFRGNSENIARRVFTEYQAKRYDVDVVSGSAATSMVQRAGFMQRFYSPHLAEYPAELKDAKGFWGSTNVYFMTLGYNTRSVKPNELPKTYEDLLQPRWRGQMMWSTSRGSGAPQFIGNILLTMGQEAGKAYLQKLKGQNIAKSTASARQILDLVIAGEYPLAVQIFNHHAYISKPPARPSSGSRWNRSRRRSTPSGWLRIHRVHMRRCCFLIFCSLKRGRRSFSYRTISLRIPRFPLCRRTSSPAAEDSKKPTTSTRTFSTIKAMTGSTIFKTSS